MWRNQQTHKEETKTVKSALVRAGLPVLKVGHGSGTAWSWLNIRLCGSAVAHQRVNGSDGHGSFFDPCWPDCRACMENRTNREATIRVALQITGRTGDYDGEINVELR